jgi:hypothetical protein
MDTLEEYYTFREAKIDNQINDKLAVRPNVIFETTVQKIPTEGYKTFATRDKLFSSQ